MKITQLLALSSVVISASAMANPTYDCSGRNGNFVLTVDNGRTLSYSQQEGHFNWVGTLNMNDMGGGRPGFGNGSPGFNGPRPGPGPVTNPNEFSFSGSISAQSQGHFPRPPMAQNLNLQVSSDIMNGAFRGTIIENGSDAYTCNLEMQRPGPIGPQGPQGPGDGHGPQGPGPHGPGQH